MATAAARAEDAVAGYAPHEQRPLAAYAGLTAAFGAALGGALVALRRELPERISAGDLALAGIATHKVSRLLAKDKDTSSIRAPFTRYQEPAGHGELEEAPRGSGARHAIGELLVCPYCLSQWIAAGFVVGLVAAPRPTRVVAGIYAAETLSDFLQLAYRAAEDRA
jgi:Protein of unknown function (DUF1360)